MKRISGLFLAVLLGVSPWEGLAAHSLLSAQPNKLGLSPKDQQKYDELIQSAQRSEMLAYIAIGVGFLVILASIPIAIYFDRKKKARKKAEEEKTPPSRNSVRD